MDCPRRIDCWWSKTDDANCWVGKVFLLEAEEEYVAVVLSEGKSTSFVGGSLSEDSAACRVCDVIVGVGRMVGLGRCGFGWVGLCPFLFGAVFLFFSPCFASWWCNLILKFKENIYIWDYILAQIWRCWLTPEIYYFTLAYIV